MSDRKQILALMKELGQNPTTRKAYSQNPQSVLTKYGIEDRDRAQILGNNWKGLVAVHNDSNVPFIVSSSTFGIRAKA